MVSHIHTVAFSGITVLPIEVQVQLAAGLPAFTIVGLPDKAVAESRERVRAALHAMGLSLPAKRLTVNLAPADVIKEGSHYDLPIALGVLGAMGALPKEELQNICALGELGLDGTLRAVSGVLPAAIFASANEMSLICPKDCGAEAAWAGGHEVLAATDLLQLVNHFKGMQVLAPAQADLSLLADGENYGGFCFSDIRGQHTAKRAMEVAAAGGHNILMMGPPGSGKSMLAARLPSILPPLSPKEALEVSMIHSLAGSLPEGGLIKNRPYRDPHHSASLPALVGGGAKAKPGEISLAHHGVLFLDELPEFARSTLESLRQPLETGQAVVARVNHHVSWPARFQLVGAMNPCKCGYLGDTQEVCRCTPKSVQDYQGRLSGPLLDRIDIHVEMPAVPLSALGGERDGERSGDIARRVAMARQVQEARYKGEFINANAPIAVLENFAQLNDEAQALLNKAADVMKLSARGYHRVLRVARSIADLGGEGGGVADKISPVYLAEALGYRPNKRLES